MATQERGRVVELTAAQRHVDAQIEARLSRICMDEWRKQNTLTSGPRKGKLRIRFVPVTYPGIVSTLLSLRQELYSGVDPEIVSAVITMGEIQDRYLKSLSEKA